MGVDELIDGDSGDGVPLTNMDFVPSIRRPPSGGPSDIDEVMMGGLLV